MKKALLSAGILLSSLGAYAQNDAVTSAFFYQKDGKLDKAKEEIDRAVTNDKTKDKAKTWFFKGSIYQDIAQSPLPAYRKLSSNAISEAYDAYKKTIELDKNSSGEYQKSAQNGIQTLRGMAFNNGVQSYQIGVDKSKKNADSAKIMFSDAIKNYQIADKIQSGDTTTILYMAYAAESIKDYDLVKKSYHELLKLGRKTPDMYRTLASYARNENKNDEALKIIQEGRKQFPGDKTLAIDELAMIGQSGKLTDSQAKIEEAIRLDPENASLYATLGSIQDQAANDPKKTPEERAELKRKAIENYKMTLVKDPNNVDANFNIGVFYFNEGVALNKKVNNMTLNDYNKGGQGKKLEAQAKEQYSKALPYFEKAHQIQPDDKAINQSLKRVYNGLGRKADADKIKD